MPHRPPPSLPFFLSKSKSFFSSVLPTLEPSTEAFKIKPGVGLIYGLAFFVWKMLISVFGMLGIEIC